MRRRMPKPRPRRRRLLRLQLQEVETKNRYLLFVAERQIKGEAETEGKEENRVSEEEKFRELLEWDTKMREPLVFTEEMFAPLKEEVRDVEDMGE